MKHISLLCLLILMVVSSCNKRYHFLKKVSVGHKVQAEMHRKPEVWKGQPNIIENLPDTMGVDAWAFEPPVTTSGKQQFKMQVQPLRLQSKKWKPGGKTVKPHFRSHNKEEEPVETWNYNAEKAFLMIVLLVVLLLGALIFPLLYFWAIIVAMIALNSGIKAYQEFKTHPEKGKWMAVVAIMVGSAMLAAGAGFLLAAAFYYYIASMQGFYIAWAIAGLLFWSFFLYGSFSKKKEKKPEKTKEEQQTEEAEKEKIAKSKPMNPNAQRAFWGMLITFLFIPLFAIAPGVALALVVAGLIYAFVNGYNAMRQIKESKQKGMGKAKFAVYTSTAIVLLFLMLAFPYSALVIIPFLIYLWIKNRRAKKAAAKPQMMDSLN